VRTSLRDPAKSAAERVASPTRDRDVASPLVQRVLRLQRTAGNSAVARLLQREAAPVDPYEELDREAAERAYKKGEASYRRGDFAHAYDFFTRSNELWTHPDIVFSAAQALRRAGGRREEALALYEKYLALGGTSRTKDAKSMIDELRGPAKTGDEAKDRKAAEKVFKKAERDYMASRFGHAYDGFMQSYALWPHPSILFSAAQALRRLGGRRQEAIALFERYVTEGGPGAARLKDAQAILADLSGPAKTGDEGVDRKAAEAVYKKAEAHYRREEFANAYDRFMQSYELWAHPDILFSAAQALRRAGGRTAETIALFEQYLATGGATRKKDAEAQLKALREFGASP
jgi:tetratricopeptide (TPR) repeat protein